MLESIIASALRHRLILLAVSCALTGFGIGTVQHLSVDAFPDVANVQVQIATEAAGKSPEEVERFVTVPIEIGMTGLAGMTDMRSLNKPGLSLITLVFSDGSDLYRERQMISETTFGAARSHARRRHSGTWTHHQRPRRSLPVHLGVRR